MSDRSRDNLGRFEGDYPDRIFLDAVQEGEMPTTADVSREVGCSRSTAWVRLKELESCCQVEGRTVGSAIVWSVHD